MIGVGDGFEYVLECYKDKVVFPTEFSECLWRNLIKGTC